MRQFKPEYAQAKSPEQDDRHHFTGEVKIQRAPSEAPEDMEVWAVWFESGSRTIPHSHPSEQILLVVQGQCVVATRDKRIILDAGEWAVISQDEWHWHGAANKKRAMHISFKSPGQGNWDQPKYDFEDWRPRDL